ncbi:uncharacterized protein LAESUDRAFT_692034 [Laetiporus sulphureus 93-53]|uniref:Mitochondrial outer membrane transport complex Sam37/metaxin N-terminal domain-containing protein n=1 Tax=Laetiporus sulphureus 93-53 TaxID=1314785 RepID=A0A165H6V9_9APHY|nr:uncharacterized protein LAESUDRAFT_692034 [Laetiporus sulphureus 93-53]KZT11324.1 hypothetical protein LAESUDRAFT_692034 [Laetiporus sulphureus 93-53]
MSTSNGFSATPLVLHIWPATASVLSIDPASVAALCHLQLAVPGRFFVAYSANPDLSPSGQLPFLTHGLHNVSGLQSIVKYVENLADALNLDHSLGPVEKAQSTAYKAHVQSEYGDLLAHMMYSLHANWWNVTRPALVSMLPAPQRYFVPGRIRESYRPRLEFAGLWNVPGIEQEDDERFSVFRERRRKKKETRDQKFKKVFEREKVLEKARAFFSLYARLLGDERFFHPNSARPSSLDVLFAAHTHILIGLPFTDTLIKSLLSESFPSLVAHATAVGSFAFPDPGSFSIVETDIRTSFSSLFPRPFIISWRQQKSTSSNEARRYTLVRWGFVSLATAGLLIYLRLFGLGPGIRFAVVMDDGKEETTDEEDGALLEDDEIVDDVDEDEEEDA